MSNRDIMTKTLLFIMIASVLYYASRITSPSNYQESTYEHHKTQTFSVAISGLVYGLDGYRGYQNVHSYFLPVSGSASASTGVLNGLLNQAQNIEDVASGGVHYSYGDLGVVDYYKLAFILFGYQVQSIDYCFTLIVVVSAIILMASFYRTGRDTLCWFVLLITVCGFVVVAPTYSMLIDHHFYTIMAIIPATHIALAVIDKAKFSAIKMIGWTLQAALLIFIIFIRSAATYQLMFLAAWFVFLVAKNLKKKNAFLEGVCVWPLVLVLFFFGSLQIYKKNAADKIYSGPLGAHLVWHNIYMGLVAHPDAGKKYGIDYYGDEFSVWFVVRKMAERGIPFNFAISEQIFLRGLRPVEGFSMAFDAPYENALRKEYLRLLVKDPEFVIGGILYKIKYYFLACFTDGRIAPAIGSIGAWKNMTQWYLLAIVAFGAFLVRGLLLVEWSSLLGLVFLEWMFSLVPSILIYPIWSNLEDTAVVLSMAIYMALAFALSLLFFGCKKIFQVQKKQPQIS